MTRLVALFSLVLAISAVPGGLAGPACARKNYQSVDCVKKCKSKWGWTGSMVGTDRWGSVVHKVENSDQTWDSIISTACGSAKPALPVTTSSVVAPSAPTFTGQPVPPIGAGSDPAQSVPTSSTVVSSSSVSVSTKSAHSSVAATSSVVSSVKSTSSHATSTSSHTSTTPTTTSTPEPKPTTSRFVTSIRPSPQPTTSEKPTTSREAPPPPPTQAPSTDSGSNSGTSSSDIQAYLSAHNTVRAQHGAAPLTWSDELAGKAQQWADGCKFQHSGGALGRFGENLAAGTGDSYGIPQAIKSWADEASDYDPNNPQFSHFTQMVWKGTTQLGCAVQECSGIFSSSFGLAKFYVCEYNPAGNVLGQFAQNVQA
ncbi:hypothetical protein Agabi119p4_633 [Agaricus bisporus var. burnettii]|uniref:SCP domain-containing protein n=1 Tax=Agaricus bisporus var. burnettii TaxID=192524 RepID=A0A8H7FAY8_AGABI|nr:hypothetical protein Agabi119p4_633 [Agaricus bisporus var. burnettii]